jgi:heme exporter protein D
VGQVDTAILMDQVTPLRVVAVLVDTFQSLAVCCRRALIRSLLEREAREDRLELSPANMEMLHI